MTTLRFEVLGKPRPKGSMRSVGPRGRGGMKEDNPESAPWREAVKWAALRAMSVHEAATGQPYGPLDGPVVVDVVFSFEKPKGAPKATRSFPITRSTCDVDKLLRNVNDALTDSQVVRDDSQVIDLRGQKAYCGEPPSQMSAPGATITVRPLISTEEPC